MHSCLHITSDTYPHAFPACSARPRKKIAPDGQIEDFPVKIPKLTKVNAQMPKTHKPQKARSFSTHLPKAVKFVGAQNPRGTTCFQQGVLDLALFEKSKGPFQQGALDLALSGTSKPPFQQGVLDLGPDEDPWQRWRRPRKSHPNCLKIRLARFARGCARLCSVYWMAPMP